MTFKPVHIPVYRLPKAEFVQVLHAGHVDNARSSVTTSIRVRIV